MAEAAIALPAIMSAAQVAGPILSAAGTVVGVMGQQAQAKALKEANELRRKQMMLEAQRNREEIIRRTQLAQATAASNASSQGVSLSSSAVVGGQQAATSQGNRQSLAVNQNEDIGQGIFNADNKYASGGTMVGFGSGLQQMGSLFNQENLAMFKRIGMFGSVG